MENDFYEFVRTQFHNIKEQVFDVDQDGNYVKKRHKYQYEKIRPIWIIIQTNKIENCSFKHQKKPDNAVSQARMLLPHFGSTSFINTAIGKTCFVYSEYFFFGRSHAQVFIDMKRNGIVV